MLMKSEYEKALKILDKLLDKYNIPNKKSIDGITRIDGLTVDEYFEKVGIFNTIIDTEKNKFYLNTPTKKLEDIYDLVYRENHELDELTLAS